MNVLVRHKWHYIMSFEIDSMRTQISANELMTDTFRIDFTNEYELTGFNEKGGNAMQLVGIVLNTHSTCRQLALGTQYLCSV